MYGRIKAFGDRRPLHHADPFATTQAFLQNGVRGEAGIQLRLLFRTQSILTRDGDRAPSRKGLAAEAPVAVGPQRRGARIRQGDTDSTPGFQSQHARPGEGILILRNAGAIGQAADQFLRQHAVGTLAQSFTRHRIDAADEIHLDEVPTP